MPVKNKESKELIMKAIKDKPGISRREIRAVTGLSKDLVQTEVTRLSRTKSIRAEYYNSDRTHRWYLKDSITIVDRIEACIRDADKALNYREIAAMVGIEQQQTANPLSILMDRGKIINGASVTLTNKDVATYLHTDNLPTVSPIQAGANNLGIPINKYEELLDLELGQAINDPEMESFLNTYYQGGKATAQFIGG